MLLDSVQNLDNKRAFQVVYKVEPDCSPALLNASVDTIIDLNKLFEIWLLFRESNSAIMSSSAGSIRSTFRSCASRKAISSR